ncbi:MAG TPA: aspartyl protease family protein [Sphingomicrobium sp.]|nr:aspartyl protease family protein [Sphingomicrobium sp.]
MLGSLVLISAAAMAAVGPSGAASTGSNIPDRYIYELPPVLEKPAAIDGQTQTDSVAFLADQADRMTVAVQLGSTGPYQFMVDTGSERTVISRQLANRLGLKQGHGVRLHSIVGVGMVNTVIIPQLQMSRREIQTIDAPMLEAANIGADGMLGVDTLKSQRILFDFKANTMSITPSSEPAESLGDGTIVVRARSREGRLVLTDAKADNQPLAVILDTGSQVSIGNPMLRRRLIQRRMVGAPETITIQSVTGATLQGEYMVLKRLEIGGVTLTNLAVVFADAHTFKQLGLDKRPALLLGMNAMRAFERVSIDFSRKKLRVKMPKSSSADNVELASRLMR